MTRETLFSRIRPLVLFGVLAVFLYMVNTGIMGAERNLREGTQAYLQLAPVDPRSLIQGDYMILDYAIENDARQADFPERSRGQFVAELDENRVVQYVRPYEDGEQLADDELLVQYRTDQYGIVSVGVDSFFFQEGLGDEYENARFAEVSINSIGAVSLVDLVGENFEPLVE